MDMMPFLNEPNGVNWLESESRPMRPILDKNQVRPKAIRIVRDLHDHPMLRDLTTVTDHRTVPPFYRKRLSPVVERQDGEYQLPGSGISGFSEKCRTTANLA